MTSEGNSAFHSDVLYHDLAPAIPKLLHLLRDPEEKTRANAAGASEPQVEDRYGFDTWGHLEQNRLLESFRMQGARKEPCSLAQTIECQSQS